MSALAQKYEAKAKELEAILIEGKTDDPQKIDLSKVTRLEGSVDEKAAEVKRRRDEIVNLGLQVDLENAQEIARKARERSENPEPDDAMIFGRKDVTEKASDVFLKSAQYKNRTPKQEFTGIKFDPTVFFSPTVETKTVMTTAAGWATRPARIAEITDIVARPIQVLDLIPQSNTDATSIIYMEETTRTNNAAEIGEGVAYPEAASVFTERTSPVRKIGIMLPVTDEQLSDVPQVRTFLDELLPFMVRQRLDQQVFNGNGTGSNLTGILTVAGIQTQAKGADPIPTAFLKAIVKVRVTGRSVPSGVLIHPTDWQSVKILQDTTGRYIWGEPSQVGPDTMWGLPMAQVDAGTAGTAVVADFRNYTRLYFREGIGGVEVGYVNDDFKLGQKTLRADTRAAFVVRRAAAVCSVTGL